MSIRPKFLTDNDLVTFYSNYKGWSLSDIRKEVSLKYPDIKLVTNKGIVGQLLEALIGNPPDSNPLPDVIGLGIELKVLPLRKNGKGIQPKERSKIKSLNYNSIVQEEWKTSDVRKKMRKILFLMYEQPTGKTYMDWEEFVFHGPLLYLLEIENEDVVEFDWNGIKQKVILGKADLISEGDGLILGACTSGSGNFQRYGNGKEAKQRSYALKHSYMKQFYAEKVKKEQFVSIEIPREEVPHEFILSALINKLSNKDLKTLSDEFAINFSGSAKSSFNLLVKRVLKVDDKKAIRELEKYGIEIKTVPVNNDLSPLEAMSFPKFSLVDLLSEKWDVNEDEEYDEAVFRSMIDRTFIFLPIIKEKEKGKFKAWKTWRVGKPVVWKPNEQDLMRIREEWEEVKRIVEKGVITKNVKYGDSTRQENNLLKSSQSDYIHIRPHARDSNDLDIPYFEHTKGKVRISWQSFWLNKDFVKKVLTKLC